MIQLRSETTGLSPANSLNEAIAKAKKDKSIWKIGFALPNGERCRLIRDGDSDVFKLEQMT